MALLARLIFPNYWETVSLAAALGEWTVVCWFLGAPAGLAPHLVAVVALFAANRLAAAAYEREDHVAPVRHRLGGVVLAGGSVAAGGAAALIASACAWLVVVRAGGLSAEAGTFVHAPADWLGPEFGVAGTLAVVAGMGLVLHGYLRGHRALETSRFEVALPNLPAAFDGFRIVHLSDFHCGPIADRASLLRALDDAMLEAPDLVLLTGDVVDSPATDLEAWMPALRRVRAPHGVVAILGNHDHKAGADRVAAALRGTAGWTVLRDDVHRVAIGDEALWLVGIDHRPTPHEGDGLGALVASVPAGSAHVALIHHPNAFAAAVAAGIPLTLAGHTHGGQVALPWARRWNPARFLMTPFDAGTFVERGCVLHVNRGLGASGQRLRIAAPREIAVITLRAARA